MTALPITVITLRRAIDMVELVGKNGAAVAQAMKTFDPDDSWKEDDELAKGE